MDVNTIETTNDKKTTYSVPVMITGGIALLLTLLVGIFGVVSTAKVREADPAVVSEAKQQASAMVPVKNESSEATIETALLDTESNAPAADLNLKNVFVNTLGGDAQTAAVNPRAAFPPPAPRVVMPQPPVQQNLAGQVQRGTKSTTFIRPKSSDVQAMKMPDRPAAPLLPTLETRYQLWEQQIAEAQKNKAAEPSVGLIYSVSEVTPTGYLASGVRKLVNFEVNQTGKNTNNSFSLEQGERLFDATVSEVTDTGVFYQFDDGSRVFTSFVADRNAKPTANITTPSVQQFPTGRVSATVKGEEIDAKLAQAVALNIGQGNTKNLLALADLRGGYTNAANFNDEIVVRKSVQTDADYFHPVRFSEDKSAAPPPAKIQDLTPCDAGFVGDTIRYTSASNLTLNEFIRDLQKLYGISFIVDKEVPNEPVFLKVVDKPWNYVLESILRSNNLEARCLTGGIISIEPKGKQSKVDTENQKTADLLLRKYTLRYVPLNSSSSAQIAGSVGGGGGNGGGSGGGPGIEGQINQLLNRGGDNRASVSRVPNSNILAVYATARQHDQIREFIEGIDKPGFQVVIETNFYTVNDSNFRDLGGQFSVLFGNGPGTLLGGVTNLPSTTTETTGNNNDSGRLLPGNFGQPNGNLRASANTLIGGSFTVGTATFQALFSAAQQKGLANSQARSTQVVLDGGTTEIKNGDTIIIPTTGSAGGSLVTSGAITVNATQSALMQPQVVVDENGNPVAVTLNLQLSNNSINRAFLGTATPVIATQSQSGTVRLPLDATYVVSGFFTDSVANSRNDTPGLSKIPGLGELFKRRTNQIDRNRLYFAISVRVVRDTDLMNVPAPSDIDTRPVPPPAPQEPGIREIKKKKT